MRTLAPLQLSPLDLDTLVAISRGQCHGTAILDDIDARAGNRPSVGLNAVYASLKRLHRMALIGELDTCLVLGERRHSQMRCYVVTDNGRDVAADEVQRLTVLLSACVDVGLRGTPSRQPQHASA